LPVLLQAWLEEARSWSRLGGAPASESGAPKAAGELEGPRSPRSSVDDGEPLYQVCLLGDAQVVVSPPQGEPWQVSWTLTRGLSLFAYLASTPGRRAGKEELTEALFAGEGSEASRRNFHPTLSYLRRDLGGGQSSSFKPVLYRSGGYELNPDYRWSIDLDAFEAHREAGLELRRAGELEGAAEHLSTAWRLYRGAFLQGVYEPWAARRREELYRAYLTLLRDLGQVRRELEDLEQALDAYRAVLIEDPLEEAVQTEVMRIYAAQGRRDLVRRQYDRLSVLLLDELGVEPLPETTAVYHRLMA
jgi:DNA-binding SARP family transcriptional activator